MLVPESEPVGTRCRAPRVAVAWASLVLGALAVVVLAESVVTGQARATRVITVDPDALDSVESARRAGLSAAMAGAGAIEISLALHSPAPPGVEVLVAVAREHGLRVIASVALTVAAAALDLPASRDHVVYRHPEWLMVPKVLAAVLGSVDPRSPDYVGRLSRWTRADPSRAQYLFVSPIDDEAVRFVAAEIRTLFERHRFDGLHLRMAHYPADDFDFSRDALASFRGAQRRALPAAQQRRMDEIERWDRLAYVESFPDQWHRFRAERLTALVASVAEAVRGARPGTTVTLARDDDADAAPERGLQNWPAWLERGLLDGVVRREDPTRVAGATARGPINDAGRR